MEGGRCFVGWKVRDLDEGREQTLRITRGKVFETEGIADAKALRWKHAGYI